MVNLIPDEPNTRLRRSATAAALTEAGFPISDKTLATKATRGGGPPYQLFGRIPLYHWGDALAWAEGRLTPPRSSTSSDRRLGVSESVAVSAATVHLFTGNNINSKGDLSSRSLKAELEVNRADPENRPFKHPDPVGWTETNRPKILRALYTLLLGNPATRPGSNVDAPTRFKVWWRLVGSAVENAALRHEELIDEQVAAMVADAPARPPHEISFRDLFLAQEEDDEEGASLAEVLAALDAKWPKEERFSAADLAGRVNDRSDYRIDEEKERAGAIREFFFPKVDQSRDVSPIAVGKALKSRVGEPVKVGQRTLTLKTENDTHARAAVFFVRVTQEA